MHSAGLILHLSRYFHEMTSIIKLIINNNGKKKSNYLLLIFRQCSKMSLTEEVVALEVLQQTGIFFL